MVEGVNSAIAFVCLFYSKEGCHKWIPGPVY
jgi:hypothetical protein